jgi:hypothetical protein
MLTLTTVVFLMFLLRHKQIVFEFSNSFLAASLQAGKLAITSHLADHIFAAKSQKMIDLFLSKR